MMDLDLSIVVPVYRNAGTLEALHIRIRQTVGPDAEILFVDDACPAGSLPVLRQIAAQDPNTGVISLAHNVGQNRAVMMGLSMARGRSIAVLDADLQDPPEVIPELLNRLGDGIHAVFAGRRGRYESGLRLLTSRTIKTLLHIFSGRRIPADAGLFVVMDRQMVKALLSYDEPEPYIIGLMGRTGLRMISFPVERAAKTQGKSGYTFGKRLALAVRALWMTFNPFLRSCPADDASWKAPIACQFGMKLRTTRE